MVSLFWRVRPVKEGESVVRRFWFNVEDPVRVRVFPPPVRVMSEVARVSVRPPPLIVVSPAIVRLFEVVPPATENPVPLAVKVRAFRVPATVRLPEEVILFADEKN